MPEITASDRENVKALLRPIKVDDNATRFELARQIGVPEQMLYYAAFNTKWQDHGYMAKDWVIRTILDWSEKCSNQHHA